MSDFGRGSGGSDDVRDDGINAVSSNDSFSVIESVDKNFVFKGSVFFGHTA